MVLLKILQSKWFTYGFPTFIFFLIAIISPTIEGRIWLKTGIAGVSTIIWIYKTLLDLSIKK